MQHKHKLKLARKLRTQQEITNHIPPFLSKAWLWRKSTRLARELKKIK